MSEAFKVCIKQGQQVEIHVDDSDGVITISYDHEGDQKFKVEADMPDSYGRTGVIYEEDFSTPAGEEFEKLPLSDFIKIGDSLKMMPPGVYSITIENGVAELIES